MFAQVARRLLPLCLALQALCLGGIATSAVRTIGSQRDADRVTEQQANLVSVVDAAYGEAVPNVGQLRRLGSDLGAYLEANSGSLEGFTADPSAYTGLSDLLGESPFVAGTICDDCGRLDADFAQRIETQDVTMPPVEARSWSTTLATAGGFTVLYLVGSTLFVGVLLRREARRSGMGWRDVRWHTSNRHVRMVKLLAPLARPTLGVWLRMTDERYDQAIERLGYGDTLAQAQATLADLRDDHTVEGRRLTAELEGLIARIDTEVATSDPELSSLDPNIRQRQARDVIRSTAEQLDVRAQAQAILEGADWAGLPGLSDVTERPDATGASDAPATSADDSAQASTEESGESTARTSPDRSGEQPGQVAEGGGSR